MFYCSYEREIQHIFITAKSCPNDNAIGTGKPTPTTVKDNAKVQ